MADIPFRVVEKELKSNLTTRLKAIDYDSRYYLNDHNSPVEDSESTDWAPGGDPGVFINSCEPETVMYSLDIVWNGSVWLPYNGATPRSPLSTSILPNSVQVPMADRRRHILIGRKTKFTGLRWSFSQLGYYAGYAMCMSATDPWGRPAYINSITHNITSVSALGDTTRNIVGGSYPANCHLAGRNGDQTWNTITNWELGLGNFYEPFYVATSPEVNAWQATTPLTSLINVNAYYWIVCASYFLMSPWSNNPISRTFPVQSAITLLPPS